MLIPTTEPDLRRAIQARWMIRLRWAAIGAQSVTGFVAAQWLDLRVEALTFALVVLSEVLFNLIAALLARRPEAPTERWIEFSLMFDLAALTSLLFVAGGVMNPFSQLYVAHVALAAIVLRGRSLARVLIASYVMFGVLYLSPSTFTEPYRHPDHVFSAHLWGIWLAYVVAATVMAAFVSRLVDELRERELKTRRALELTQRSTRLASLAALAAGAAHEMSTPLSTIAVVAGELEEAARFGTDLACVAEDARLVRQEVDRCRRILDRMAVDSGFARGDRLGETPLEVLVDEVLQRVRGAEQVDVRWTGGGATTLRYPAGPLTHAISAVIQNAIKASSPHQRVELEVERRARDVRLHVRDQGVGMAADVLERATEPFFTTRETGSGMGLGLFLAQNVAQTLGGDLQIASTPGRGTTVTMTLPVVAAVDALRDSDA